MTLLTRRSLLGGIGAVLAAPYIVRAASLMPVKPPATDEGFRFSGFYSMIPINQIGMMAMDAEGTIWVQASGKMIRYEPLGVAVVDDVLTERYLDAERLTVQYLYSA